MGVSSVWGEFFCSSSKGSVLPLSSFWTVSTCSARAVVLLSLTSVLKVDSLELCGSDWFCWLVATCSARAVVLLSLTIVSGVASLGLCGSGWFCWLVATCSARAVVLLSLTSASGVGSLGLCGSGWLEGDIVVSVSGRTVGSFAITAFLAGGGHLSIVRGCFVWQLFGTVFKCLRFPDIFDIFRLNFGDGRFIGNIR